VVVPSMRPPEPGRPFAVEFALPRVPEELAVPRALVPGAVGTFCELPAPLGSFPELFRPTGFAGPLGTPLTAAVPAPAAPAAGEPTAELVLLDGPLAAPPVEPPLLDALPPDWARMGSGAANIARTKMMRTALQKSRMGFLREHSGNAGLAGQVPGPPSLLLVAVLDRLGAMEHKRGWLLLG